MHKITNKGLNLNTPKYTSKNIVSLLFISSIIFILSIFTLVPQTAYADAKSDMDAADAAATQASEAYDAAVQKQNEIETNINEKNTKIEELNTLLQVQQTRLSDSVVMVYKCNLSLVDTIIEMMSGSNITEALRIYDAYNNIMTSCDKTVDQLIHNKNKLNKEKEDLEAAKIEQDAAVAEADAAKQDALAKRDAARAAYNSSLISSSAGVRGNTSAVAYDEESARAFIMGKESGGRYDARNGRYYGAYQLDISYLNGDLSPENQDRVANNYVMNRYGSWMNAVAFWQTHHWY